MSQEEEISKPTATGNAPASPVSASPVPASRTATFHEGITATLAVVISAMALWMLGRTFLAGAVPFGGPEAEQMKAAYDRQKDVMQYGLALLGTVTGYYLGRVPAERRAESAQQSSEKAQATAQSAQKEVVAAREQAATATEQATQVKKQTREAIREAKVSLESQTSPIPGGAQRKTLSAEPGFEAGSEPVAAAIARLDRLLSSLD